MSAKQSSWLRNLWTDAGTCVHCTNTCPRYQPLWSATWSSPWLTHGQAYHKTSSTKQLVYCWSMHRLADIDSRRLRPCDVSSPADVQLPHAVARLLDAVQWTTLSASAAHLDDKIDRKFSSDFCYAVRKNRNRYAEYCFISQTQVITILYIFCPRGSYYDLIFWTDFDEICGHWYQAISVCVQGQK